MPEVQFNIRLNEHLEQYTEAARRIDGEQNQIRFHTFLVIHTPWVAISVMSSECL